MQFKVPGHNKVEGLVTKSTKQYMNGHNQAKNMLQSHIGFHIIRLRKFQISVAPKTESLESQRQLVQLAFSLRAKTNGLSQCHQLTFVITHFTGKMHQPDLGLLSQSNSLLLHKLPYFILPILNAAASVTRTILDAFHVAGAFFQNDISCHPAQQHRSEEHTSELQSRPHLVCRLL